MSDNLKIRQPQDPTKINTHEEWEMNYWSTKWGVTKEQIKQAVAQVGNGTEKVRQYLRK